MIDFDRIEKMTHNELKKAELKMLQSLPLDIKIEKSKLRIHEWYDYFHGRVYVSFSGGKDSTVLLHLVRSLYPDVPAVFVDTGLEYPEIRDFVKTIDNVIWLRPKMGFKQVIEKYGYPVISKEVSRYIQVSRNKPNGKTAQRFNVNSDYVKKYGEKFYLGKWSFLKDSNIPVSDYCCKIMKKDPLNAYSKETESKPFVGSLASESLLRKKHWINNGCNAFYSKNPISTPLSFWKEQDILTYIINNKLNFCSIYGDIIKHKNRFKTTGVNRTGCMFCMFGVHLEKDPNRFQRMKETHPKLYKYCMEKLGLDEVLTYCGIKH